MNVYECTLVIADGMAETQAVGAAIELQVERIIGTQAATSGGVSDGNKGDITVSGSGTVWNINAGAVDSAELASNSVTSAKIASGNVSTDKLTDGAVTEVKIADGSVTVTKIGTGAVNESKLATGSVTETKLGARSVTAAKLFEVGHEKLIGRHGAGAGDAQEIGIDGGLEFHGGNIRRAALTGDVTAGAGDNATTIATGAVTTAKMGGDVTTAGKALLDDADAAAQRTTLGLGTAATANTGDFAAASHTHTLSNLTQSGATTGQVVQWNGMAWEPATSSGGGSTNLWFPAAQWIPRTTNGCGVDSIELSTNKINLDELLFDAASIEYAQLATVMPTNWDLGTITAKFHWRAASGSGDVVWALSARSYANDDALDQATGTAQSVTDTLTAANDLCVSPATPAITVTGTAASGNLVLFEVSRTATAGGDTLAVDARLVGVEISYTSI